LPQRLSVRHRLSLDSYCFFFFFRLTGSRPSTRSLFGLRQNCTSEENVVGIVGIHALGHGQIRLKQLSLLVLQNEALDQLIQQQHRKRRTLAITNVNLLMARFSPVRNDETATCSARSLTTFKCGELLR
jgi:hypothetical protein